MNSTRWTRERIIDALQEWTRTHGRAPSANDWRSHNRGYPTAVTVRGVFGTFGAARKAAGVVFLRKNAAGVWTRQDVINAVYRWVFLHGDIPRADDWVVSVDGFPTEWWVARLFGSWSAGIAAAGYRPRMVRKANRKFSGLRGRGPAKSNNGPGRNSLDGNRATRAEEVTV